MYSRREFSKLALASLPLTLAIAKGSSKVNGVRIGVQSYSFRTMSLDDAIKAMKGVKHAFVIEGRPLPSNFPNYLNDDPGLESGIAIVADSWWAANSAREKLEVKWDEGKWATADSAAMAKKADELSKQEAMRTLRQSTALTPETDLESGLKEVVAQWPNLAERPQLLSGVGYVVKTSDGRLLCKRMPMNGKQFSNTPWPVELTSRREFLEQQRKQPMLEPPADIRTLRGELIAGRPVILFPLLALREERKPAPPAGAPAPLKGWGILELNDEYLKTQFLPELVLRHFGQSGLENYLLAVVSGASHQILYQPESVPGSTTLPPALTSVAVDARIAIFGNKVLPPLPAPGPPEEGRRIVANRPRQNRRPSPNAGRPRNFPPPPREMNNRPPAENQPPDDLSWQPVPRLPRPACSGYRRR